MTDQSDILTGSTVVPQQTTQEVVAQSTTQQVDPNTMFAERLKALKNEETGLQKYASVDDALVGALHAQEHVKRLELENTQARDELNQLRAEKEQVASLQETSYQAPSSPATSSFGRDDVYSIMMEHEQNKVLQDNQQSVRDTLLSHCNGDVVKADELLNSRAKSLGMSREQLSHLATTSPTAICELLGLTQKGSTLDLTSGTINADALESNSTKKEFPKRSTLKIGASSKELTNEWKASKSEVHQRLGID